MGHTTMYYFRIQKLQREPLDQGNPPRLIMSLIFLHRRNYELARKGSAIYTDACGDTEGHWGVLERITLDFLVGGFAFARQK